MEDLDTKTPRSPPPPTPPEEPDAKKLKTSTTTTTADDEDAATGNTKKQRYKRFKVAIFFAYCGVGYQGMQKNPGAKTIEGDLDEALYLSGAIPKEQRNNHKRYDWARSARTDKGVSAVGQVVSGRFYIDPPGLVDRLNSNLSPQIRIFGYKRVTPSFNAKKFCDRRRYVYLIPVFALDPSAHPTRESVMASLGSENELVKCLECSERGRKVAGLMGKRNYELSGASFESGISSNSSDANLDSIVGDEIGVPSVNGDGENQTSETTVEVKVENGNGENQSPESTKEIKVENGNGENQGPESTKEIKVENGDSESNQVEDRILASDEVRTDLGSRTGEEENVYGQEKPVKSSDFSYGEKERERFNRILQYYVGTHNFHNFTTRTKAEDPSASRFIVSFHANTVVMVEGMEFVKCEVVGQSFMLHQIRKMIGLAVAVMRNCAPESLIEKALQKDVNINVPTAPEVGLYLDECFFPSYNQKWKDSHEELSMKSYEEEAEDFKMKYIYSHIGLTEQKAGVVALWLHSLNYRNYPDLQVVDNKNAANTNGADAENKVE